MIIEVKVGDKPISHTTFSLRNTCGKRFQLQRIINVPETPGMFNAGGSAVHIVTAVIDYLLTVGYPRDYAVLIALRYAAHPGLDIAFEEVSRHDDGS
jgi:hypothetical protein